MPSCSYREQRGSPGYRPWYYCHGRARQVTPFEDCRTESCHILAACAAKSARKEAPAMSDPDPTAAPAAPKKPRRLIDWDGPATLIVPSAPEGQSLRIYAAAEMKAHGQERGFKARLVERLGVDGNSIRSAISKVGPKAAPKPARTSAAPPRVGGDILDPPAVAVPPAPTVAASSSDWQAARDLVQHADPDELAEFVSAFDLTDRFDAFVVGLRRGRRGAVQPSLS
jgi:hypothetical protein